MEEKKKSAGMAVASLILGIAGLVLCCIPFLNIILALLGVIFGIIVLVKHKEGKGLAIAGIVCGAIALILGVEFVQAIIEAANEGNVQINGNDALFTYNGYSTNNFINYIKYVIDSNK